MRHRFRLGLLALAATVAACDRPAPTAVNEEAPVSPVAARSTQERDAMDRVASRLARAMADPTFRAYVKSQLDQSPYVEHKLQLQRFLHGSGRRALKETARLNRASEATVEAEVSAAIPLEFYFPVPAHRATWSGGPDVLVASALYDRDAPVAYDVHGGRRVLSAAAPPVTPVLALGPVETDFGTDGRTPNLADPLPPPPLPPPPPPTPPAGLYMTYSHFVQDFEGWFKGDPEFEIHILGQSGASDSLRDYQCAGGQAAGYYRFDQNSLTWSGSSVLLFSQTQLSNYKLAHPNQNFRVIALEDDDTGCVIKFDANRFKNMVATFQAQYPNLTGAKDTTSGTLVRYVKRANALQKILSSLYSFITTQDDLIGNAIEDVVVGQFYTNANWVVKGESNVTNGWIKLEMR
jgi:hypothetical protein